MLENLWFSHKAIYSTYPFSSKYFNTISWPSPFNDAREEKVAIARFDVLFWPQILIDIIGAHLLNREENPQKVTSNVFIK